MTTPLPALLAAALLAPVIWAPVIWAPVGLSLGALAEGPPLEEAEELRSDGQGDGAARLLGDWLQRNAGTAEAHALYGEALADLGRRDEAAHQLEEALLLLEADGRGSSKEHRSIKSRLHELDRLASRREAYLNKLTDGLLDVAERMHEAGHAERALELLERIQPIARGKTRRELEPLLEEARAAFRAVQLDQAARGGAERGADGELPVHQLESEHYVLVCNLEPDVVQLVADTMDDIFGSYVAIYFDGQGKRVSKRKATIRIHPSREAMLATWSDPSRAPAGWWSAGEWMVVGYDTRSDVAGDGGSLDMMLTTLFHEASHQFMTMLALGSPAGSSSSAVPSWLNEGTASFFEGATAMADHRVLWPDAPLDRLGSLSAMLRGEAGPAVADVLGYDEPGSYPGEYYPLGWGLVFYLQQYEHPGTLAYVWRPAYEEYRDLVIDRGGDPLVAFEEVVLGRGNPGGFGSLDDFVSAWKAWILDEVYPLHFGSKRRELRLARLERYVAAADRSAAGGGDRMPVPERELLLRALRETEAIRDGIDPPDEPDAELLLVEADVLERLERGGSAAAALERVLELADDGRIELTDERRAELEERMGRLDRRNQPLRQLALRARGYRSGALRILSDYEKGDDPPLLRAWSFAHLAGSALDDQEELLPAARALQARARDAGLIASRIVRVEGELWLTILSSSARSFEPGPGRVMIENPGRPAGRICTDLTFDGEYEVRCRLVRSGRGYSSSYYGVVVAGRPDSDWYAVGIGDRDRIQVKRCRLSREGGGVLLETAASFTPSPALGEDETPELRVRVLPGACLRIHVGERAPQDVELPDRLPREAHVGVLVKDGGLTLQDLHVEVFP